MDVFISKIRKHLRQDERIKIINIHSVGFKMIIED
jgi:DNA-binding response OmpR family regulator